MKPIHVCLIFGLHVSPIANEFLFVDLAHIINFRMRRFPKKKNTYGLKKIDGDLKQAKLERHHDDVLRLNLLKIILSFLLPNKGRNIENHGKMLKQIAMSTIRDNTLPLGDGTLLLGQYQLFTPKKIMKSKREEEENLIQQVAPRERLEVVKDLIVEDEVEAERKVNMEAISSEYGGDLLEWKMGDEKDDEDEKDDSDKKDVEEKMEDSEQQTLVVYYDGKKANETMEAKIDVVLFYQEEVVGKAYQNSTNQITIVSVEEQSKVEVIEGKNDDDGISQKKPNPMKFVLIESEVDITLKKRHTLTDEDINNRTFSLVCQMNLLHAHLDELLSGVLFEYFIQRPISHR
ncbi:hypothetical protein GIB67_040040 [Kingdonia uniflora]|uniref:Uncharacterized protein n=1 Tax=Kingdonia uniflora TaxID=39325 RepID=A0A7J7MUF8_9MAGN|nr:hypothetical protein GIB67_040040 [Kingdonia uniflora]